MGIMVYSLLWGNGGLISPAAGERVTSSLGIVRGQRTSGPVVSD